MKANKILKQEALDTIRGKWGSIIGAFAVYLFVSIILSVNPNLDHFGLWAIVGVMIYFVLRICIAPSLTMGINTYILKFSRN